MALEPAQHNLSVWKGATFRRRIELWQDEAETNPYNLAGYTASMPIYNKRGGTLLTTIVPTIATNVVTILIPAATVSGYTWKSSWYELFLTAPAGDVDLLLYGAFTIK